MLMQKALILYAYFFIHFINHFFAVFGGQRIDEVKITTILKKMNATCADCTIRCKNPLQPVKTSVSFLCYRWQEYSILLYLPLMCSVQKDSGVSALFSGYKGYCG